MQKIIIILFVTIIAGGCSLARKTINPTAVSAIESKSVLDITEKQNLSSAGFFIQKAEVELSNQYRSQKFLASIKFEYPGKYLISLKSRTGIEGVRIFISDDSLFVNDRINKKMYFGKTLFLKRKFGISKSLLPLIFGDLLIRRDLKTLNQNCVNDYLMFNCILDGVSLNYKIDCQKGKVAAVMLKTNYLTQTVSLKSSGYIKADKILVPRNIEAEDFNSNTKIKIKYIKIEHPWNGTVKFVEGKGYELIELL